MYKTRLFEMFNSLKESDYKDFGEIVHSPYFNKSSRVINLWNYLLENNEEPDAFSKEKIIKAVFGEEKFNDANFRVVIAAFVKLTEKYYLVKEMESGELDCKIKLLEVFQNRKLKKSYSMYIKEIESELLHVKKKNTEYYYRMYFIECVKLIEGTGSLPLAKKYLKMMGK